MENIKISHLYEKNSYCQTLLSFTRCTFFSHVSCYSYSTPVVKIVSVIRPLGISRIRRFLCGKTHSWFHQRPTKWLRRPTIDGAARFSPRGIRVTFEAASRRTVSTSRLLSRGRIRNRSTWREIRKQDTITDSHGVNSPVIRPVCRLTRRLDQLEVQFYVKIYARLEAQTSFEAAINFLSTREHLTAITPRRPLIPRSRTSLGGKSRSDVFE